MNDKKEFVAYLQKKYKDLSEEKLKLLQESGLLEKDYKEFLKSKKLKALHGAKLNYIKSLKNQCAEDEELYYYKKGGVVGCGCKKKKDGGEIEKALKGVVAEFKNRKRTKAELDKINKQSEEDYFNGEASHSHISKSTFKKDRVTGHILEERVEGKDSMYYERTPKGKMVSSSSNRFKDKDSRRNFESDRDYFHKDDKKLKKHQLGGSLNGIPFYLGGTPKGGLQYKPNWYKSIQAKLGVFDKKGDYYEVTNKRSLNGDTFSRKIKTLWSLHPLVSDTTYEYFPKQGQPEIESTTSLYDHNRKNYEKLKEMFNKIVSIPVNKSPVDLYK